MNTWRNHCSPIIMKVILENKGKSENEIKAALRKAYPYGERKNHPYKIWLDEIQVQLGKKNFNNKRRPITDKRQLIF